MKTRSAYNPTKLTRNCRICGSLIVKEKTTSLKAWNGGQQIYCSRKCKGQGHEKDGFSERMAKVNKGKPSWNKGKKHSPEHLKNNVLAHKGQVAWNKGKKYTEEEKKKINMDGLLVRKYKATGIEVKIEQELIKRGINYQTQVYLCKVTIADFYLPEYRIIIQADGCYWHNCPIHGGDYKKERNGKDAQQDKVLTFNGFNVYRFWEHDINKSVEDCINQLPL
jgi:DNA mismatch endonuclease (patch repair protein)